MKKKITLLLLAIAMILPVAAQSQLKLGVKGGLNVSKMSISQDVLDSDNQTGWFVGPTLKFTVPIVGLSFDASALYNQRTTQLVDAQNVETSFKQKSIEVPINLRYGIGLGNIDVFAFAGPQFGFNVGDDEFDWKDRENLDNTFQLKKSTLSANVGLGVTIGRLQVEANYNIACGKTGEAKVWDTVKDAYEQAKDAKNYDGKTNTWQISLGFFF